MQNKTETDRQEVEPELVDFLRFAENSTREVAEESEDKRIHDMYKRIASLKSRAEMEMDYMKAEEWRRIMEEEAERRGLEAGMEAGQKIGLEVGKNDKLKSVVLTMTRKGYEPAEITDILDEDREVIEKIIRESQLQSCE